MHCQSWRPAVHFFCSYRTMSTMVHQHLLSYVPNARHIDYLWTEWKKVVLVIFLSLIMIVVNISIMVVVFYFRNRVSNLLYPVLVRSSLAVVRDVVHPPSLPPFPGGQKHPRCREAYYVNVCTFSVAGDNQGRGHPARDAVRHIMLMCVHFSVAGRTPTSPLA